MIVYLCGRLLTQYNLLICSAVAWFFNARSFSASISVQATHTCMQMFLGVNSAVIPKKANAFRMTHTYIGLLHV